MSPRQHPVQGLSIALVNGRVKVARVCPLCGQRNVITLPKNTIHGIRRWRSGEASIQTALPMLTPAERETLLSGSHDVCWDKAHASGSEN